ncbi:MAG: DsbA family oxidoreductase [Cellulomonas sp.]
MTITPPAPSPATSATTRLQVDVWSDVACPWCFIGKRRFATALAQFEHREQVDVTWRSYELAPDAEVGSALTEAELLVERKGIPLEAVTQMFEQVTAMAAAEGLAYDFATVRPANTFDAHRVVHLAEAVGPDVAGAVVEALMTAHFCEGVAVDDREQLAAIADRCGLSASDVRAALAGDEAGQAAAAAVRADIDQARAIGITGVPFFAFDRRLAVSGAQSTELFASALDQAWAGLEPESDLA